MRVLLVSNRPTPRMRGAQYILLVLAEYIIANGDEVLIVDSSKGALGTACDAMGVEFTPLEFTGSPRHFAKIKKTVLDFQPDVIHSFSIFPLWLIRRLGVINRSTATFATVNRSPMPDRGRNNGLLANVVERLKNLVGKRESPRLDAIFPLSKSVEIELRSLGYSGNMILTNSCVNITRIKRESESEAKFEIPNDSTPIIGTAASDLNTQKGIDILLSSVAILKEAHPDLICLIAGGGDNLANLKRQANNLGITGNIRFLGFLDSIAPFMNCLDIYVLPSFTEALNTTILEAMVLGKPIVSTDVGSASDVVIPDQTGFLVPPGDSVEMASAISTLLSSSDLRRTYGENASKLVSGNDYSAEYYFATVWAQYEAAVSKNRGLVSAE